MWRRCKGRICTKTNEKRDNEGWEKRRRVRRNIGAGTCISTKKIKEEEEMEKEDKEEGEKKDGNE